VDKPTIAEEHLARTMAFWHGCKMLYRRPDGQWITVADTRQTPSGWGSRFEDYANRHWEEYVSAAKAIIEQR
jgi:uncharacterized circularly permuted ATP-grasp superfamily protein